ncbi:unnamed protein product [Pleuronectes platessa]|uniref:Uncharacterized protein n=1 Tax=Pleuronectes platessa TaxID=8262 RepID=A0A9N7TK64_PLEPL|nr:unnamed protein product [Pleuronectes platessa]
MRASCSSKMSPGCNDKHVCGNISVAVNLVSLDSGVTDDGGAPKQPKQALRCRGSPLVTPSVYRTAQCAGDSDYQQMTVAVPNVDQMAIQGSRMYSCSGGGGGEEQGARKTKE